MELHGQDILYVHLHLVFESAMVLLKNTCTVITNMNNTTNKVIREYAYRIHCQS